MKSPSRVQILKNIEPGLALPPQPIITRWETLIKAVNYYSKYFDNTLRVFGALNDDETTLISISQEILNDNTVRSDIIFIASNYGFLENSITQLEQSMQPLHVQIKIVTDAIDSINLIQVQVARPIGNR